MKLPDEALDAHFDYDGVGHNRIVAIEYVKKDSQDYYDRLVLPSWLTYLINQTIDEGRGRATEATKEEIRDSLGIKK